MLRSLVAFGFYTLVAPLIALIGFPWTLLTGKIDLLYWMGTRAAFLGIRLAGIRVEILGRERLDQNRAYIFMCNHVSNVDPPIVVPLIPGRTSVLVKKELFRIPLLSRAMRLGSLVPVDRSNREAAIASLEAAADVLRQGIHMTIFPEGTRSRDGKLLPLKKGPFYLAMDTGVPIVPMTILGTFEIMAKGSLVIRKGTATLIFHDPVDPKDFPSREALMEAVREKIAEPLPPERR
ncbi:MAG TPA: lysophospholipid acyltransferase family protein [Terriglobales bacterium]|nr:lysophospholipid acyltransferase family protein [Terriglobales bacterium]